MLKPADATKLMPVACDGLVRLGARHDGGYVVPLDCIKHCRHLISLGLSLDWSFEQDFLRHNPGTVMHCYDHTMSRGRAASHSLKSLVKLFGDPSHQRLKETGKYFSYRRFFSGHVHHHQSRVWYNHEGDSVTVWDVFEQLAPQGAVFVKIAIERSEYRLLDELMNHADRIGGMVVEFHDIDIMAERFDDAIAMLSSAFRIVHIHGNNYGGLSPFGLPNVLEITFKHKTLFEIEPAISMHTYPVHGLDAPNDPELPDLVLKFGA